MINDRRRKKHKIKKDYQQKNLRNPFFRKDKKKPGRHHWLLIGMAAAALAIFLVWFFLAAPLWKIDDIKVDGLTRSNADNLKAIIWQQAGKRRLLLFKQDNLFMFDSRSASAAILAAYNFSSLKIEKLPFGTLSVKVGERPYAFIFQQGNTFFYTSPDGYIIREVPVSEADKTRYLILENRDATDLVGTGNKINISSEYLDFIVKLGNALSGYQELPVERFVIDQEYNTVKVKFRNGPFAYFNIKNDPEDQINNLLTIKKEKIKDNFSKINYIDLRYGDKLYFN